MVQDIRRGWQEVVQIVFAGVDINRGLNHNLEYGDTKSGQLRYWLVKKIFFICMQSKKFRKELMLKFKMISRTYLVFMIAFTVYE